MPYLQYPDASFGVFNLINNPVRWNWNLSDVLPVQFAKYTTYFRDFAQKTGFLKYNFTGLACG